MAKKIVIVGGSLQGTEAAYLAHHAGWKTIVIDKKANVPASGLCTQFIELDVTNIERLNRRLSQEGHIDLVIPATEDDEALAALCEWREGSGIPLTFDAAAYAVSSSKERSNQLFTRLKLPMPQARPGHFPVIAKPDHSSGSQGVTILKNHEELNRFFKEKGITSKSSVDGWIFQEYIEGPSFSIEVVGYPGHYLPLLVTDLHMDEIFDCKRVTTPTVLASHHVKQFSEMAVSLAEAIQLHGVMDIEVILHDDQLKLLEIDARLPSQTPAAVFHATGINILELVAQIFLAPATMPETASAQSLPVTALIQKPKTVTYKHIHVTPNGVKKCGEHILKDAGPLTLLRNFYGANVAMTNYKEGRKEWVATLISY